MTTTQFCVIPIEDEEGHGIEVHSSQTPPPSNKPSSGKEYEIDEDSIPLPGTPSDIDDVSIKFKLRPSASSPSSTPLNTTIAVVSLSEEGSPQQLGSLESIRLESGSTSSSIGSEQSVRSTDMLLPGGGGSKGSQKKDSRKRTSNPDL